MSALAPMQAGAALLRSVPVRAAADRTERSFAAVIAAGGVVLEAALLLRWQGAAIEPPTPIFGSIDSAEEFLRRLPSPQIGWTVHPLAAVLLGGLGVAALAYAWAVLAGRRVRAPLAGILALVAAIAVGYCALRLASGVSGVSGEHRYLVRGPGPPPPRGTFSILARPEHGPGVVIALVGSAMLCVASILAAAGLRRAR